jgi:predicted metal-dependent hydrolase
MHLRVRPDGGLRVTCPKRVAKREILSFLRDSEGFIKKCLEKLKQQTEKYPAKKFVSDEPFLYLGQRLPLQIIWSWNPRITVRTYIDHIEMLAPLTSKPIERQKALFKYMQRQAREVFANRVEIFSKQMDLHPASVSVRGQKTRWGSCSSEGRVNLNWKLLAAPPEIIDYVVIHELAHLRHMNHSPQFWDLVTDHFPGHREAKRWLRGHEAEISVQFKK